VSDLPLLSSLPPVLDQRLKPIGHLGLHLGLNLLFFLFACGRLVKFSGRISEFMTKYASKRRIVALSLTLALVLGFSFGLPQAPAFAKLPSKSAIKDARILLRNSLPVENESLRSAQKLLEEMPRQANLKRWKNLSKDIDVVTQTLNQGKNQILAETPANRLDSTTEAFNSLSSALVPLQESITAKDRNSVKPLSEKALDYIGVIESNLVKAFPFTIPAKYAGLPQLKGRALVEITTTQGSFIITVDGYSSPLNSGKFVSLVKQGFYDNLPFSRADEHYYLQTGDPDGPADGDVDPATGKNRTVPLEVRIPGQTAPIYGSTLEELGYDRVLPVLPFSAYGTVAMARSNDDPNSGSSQFFIYLFESELTPAGLNLLDGNYSVFGYVTEGQDVLYKLRLEDKVLSARLISGGENLVE